MSFPTPFYRERMDYFTPEEYREKVIKEGLEKIEQIDDEKELKKIAMHGLIDEFVEAAIEKITDQETLGKIVVYCNIKPIDRITDQMVLAEVAFDTRDPYIRDESIKKITNQEIREELLKKYEGFQELVDKTARLSRLGCVWAVKIMSEFLTNKELHDRVVQYLDELYNNPPSEEIKDAVKEIYKRYYGK